MPVKNDKGKHPVQNVHKFLAVLYVKMKDYFRIGCCAEFMTLTDQFLPEFNIIIYFAIENDRTGEKSHRLPSGSQVNYRKPLMEKTYRTFGHYSFFIRPPVMNGRCHFAENTAFHIKPVFIYYAYETTHIFSFEIKQKLQKR
jgi:hypothetical protein